MGDRLKITELLKRYGLIPIIEERARIEAAWRQLSRASQEEAKKDRKARRDAWVATKHKPVGL